MATPSPNALRAGEISWTILNDIIEWTEDDKESW